MRVQIKRLEGEISKIKLQRERAEREGRDKDPS
jgi:hypothetical protein